MGLLSVIPLVKRGGAKQLDHHNMWQIPSSIASANAWETFEPYWNAQLQTAKYVLRPVIRSTSNFLISCTFSLFIMNRLLWVPSSPLTVDVCYSWHSSLHYNRPNTLVAALKAFGPQFLLALSLVSVFGTIRHSLNFNLHFFAVHIYEKDEMKRYFHNSSSGHWLFMWTCFLACLQLPRNMLFLF